MTVKARPRGIPHYEQTVRELAASLDAAKARTAKLRGPKTELTQDPAVLREALEELRVHQEELAVANEELRAQLDELGSAASRVHAERDRYRKLFDLTPDSYFVTDHVGTIRDVNAAASRMLDIETRFLRGKPLAVLVEAADSRSLREAIGALRTRPSLELELRFRRRSGALEWHTLKAVVMDDDSAILWFARNVQAQHDARVALAGATDDARVAERSAQGEELARAHRDMKDMLARERRLRAQLEQQHVAKDRVLSVLARDLRAPLNAVVGWAQLLRREHLDQAARDRALSTIERNAQTQLRLVEELLDISRVDEGTVQVERSPVIVDELVRHATDAIVLDAADRGIEVVTTLGPERLIVAGDRRRLEHALANLLANALQSMPPAGGRVVVELQHSGGEARIIVTDTGRGIAEDALRQVFDPFRPADPTATNERGGLGLYIVRQCMEIHGGRVLAESDGPGHGARFTLVLPLAEAHTAAAGDGEPASSLARPARPARPAKTRALDGVRVLVVDDEEDTRDLMGAILEHQGALVTTATDVEAALHAFDASPVDVVLSDLALPGRSGFDLARELRGRAGAETTLVAVSGYSGADQIETALAAGFDFHVAKPIDPTELVELVSDAARVRMR